MKSTILYIFTCLLGLFFALSPGWLSGFKLMPWDPGDTLLNHYFLEHSFQIVAGIPHLEKMFSPNFFYPFENVLALSDNLLGTAPIYWIARLFSPPEIAYPLWIITLFSLNFFGFLWVMRKFSVRHWLANTASFLFAFNMPRVVEMAHIQLLPVVFTPLAIWMTVSFLRSPRRRKLVVILMLTFWQMASGIYLGWFLLFSLLIFLALSMLMQSETRNRLRNYLLRDWKFSIISLGLWTSGMVLFLQPYLKMKDLVGVRSYQELEPLMPTVQSWISAFAYGTLWSSTILGKIGLNEPNLWLGLSVCLLTLFSLYGVLQKRSRYLTDEQHALVSVCLATFFSLLVISLRLPFGISLWRIVYYLVPGASAIRAVSRISLIANVYLFIAIFINLDAYLRMIGSRGDRASRNILKFIPWTYQKPLALLLCVCLVLEQIVTSMPIYAVNDLHQRYKAIGLHLKSQCDVIYINTSDALAQQQEPLMRAVHLRPQMPSTWNSTAPFIDVGAITRTNLPFHLVAAMWIGLYAQVPVVNGYSGNNPPGYQSSGFMSLPQVLSWLESFPKDTQGMLCYASDQSRGLLADLKVESFTAKGQPHFPSQTLFIQRIPLPYPKQFSQQLEIMAYKTYFANSTFTLPVIIKNTSNFMWNNQGHRPISLSYQWLNISTGKPLDYSKNLRTPLVRSLQPGETLPMEISIQAPDKPGKYALIITPVQEKVSWLVNVSSQPVKKLAIEIMASP